MSEETEAVFAPFLDHIQLAAPPNSEEAARSFFTNVLGFQELPKPQNGFGGTKQIGGVWFEVSPGGLQVHIGIQDVSTSTLRK